MRKYKTQIIQMLILSILLTFYYINSFQQGGNLTDVSSESSNVVIKYGKGPETFINADNKDSTLFLTDKSLNLESKVGIEDIILGDTITSSKNKIYFNNFKEITVVTNEREKSYKTTLDDYILDVIYDQQIVIEKAYATDDYYHSIAQVKLESTINFPVDASIITQIKDGKRHDLLVYEKVEGLSYDEENNEYHIFYSTSNASDSVYMFNDLISSKVIWDEENEKYVVEGKPKSQGQKLSEYGVTYVSPIISKNTKIIYSKEVGISDRTTYNFYIANYDSKKQEIHGGQTIISKEVMEDDILEIDSVITIKDKVYIFFSDLEYYEINLETHERAKYIVSKTGKIDSIDYTSDGGTLYTIFTTDKTVTIATINEGTLANRVTTTKTDLEIGVINYDVILEFHVMK